MHKKISVSSAILMSINIMVGGGLLSGPAPMAAIAKGASFLGWLIVAIINLPTVWTVVKCAELMPPTHYFSNYPGHIFGRFVGFFSSWTYFFTYLCACSALLSVYMNYLGLKFSSIFIFQSKPLFLLVAASILFALNNLPTSILASVQSFLTIIKLTPVFIAIGLLPFFWSNPVVIDSASVAKLPGALTFAIFGFLGFEFCASIFDLIEGGATQARKAILGGYFAVACLYVIFHFSLLKIMGAEGLAAKLAPNYPYFVSEVFPTIGLLLLVLIPLTSMITYFNSSNGLYFLNTSILHSIAKSETITASKIMQALNSAERPTLVVAICGILTIIFGLTFPSVDALVAMTNLGISVVFTLIAVAMLLRKDVTDKLTIFDRIAFVLSAILSVGSFAYNLVTSGNNVKECMFNLGLFGVMLVIGAFLYKPQENKSN